MTRMPAAAIGLGLTLVAYGLATGIGAASPTAFIPAFFGAPIALLGVVALSDKARKHAMHLAAMVGLLGALGGLGMGLPKLFKLIGGSIEPDKLETARNACKSQLVLGCVCVIFVALCVNSFIQARKARQAAAV